MGCVLGDRAAIQSFALGWGEVLSAGRWRGALDAVGASGAGPAGAVAMTVQRDEARAPRTRFMITDILDAPPRDLSAHRDSDSDRSATDSPGKYLTFIASTT